MVHSRASRHGSVIVADSSRGPREIVKTLLAGISLTAILCNAPNWQKT
jgi:hypothetical protein